MGGEESTGVTRLGSPVFDKNQKVAASKQPMSRNNVFKVSGNMALGGQDNYPNNDFDNIKSSLKLLKSKQQGPKREAPYESNVHHPQSQNLNGGSYSSSAAQRQPVNSRNLQDYNGNNYQQGGQNRPVGQSHKDVYDHHYPSEQPTRQPRNQTQNYDYKQTFEKGGYDNGGYDKGSYDKGGYDKGSYDKGGYDKGSYEKGGYDKGGYDKGGYDKGGYQQPKYNKPPPQKPQYQYQQEEYQPPKKNQRQQPVRQEYNKPSYKPSNGGGDQQYEEKTIKQVNRQNRVQIKEYDPSELKECRMGCGRSFNPDSISKHEGICKKVFQKKRKEFNAQDQRLVVQEQKKFMKKGQVVEKKLEEKKAKEKLPKWKAESLQLRAGIKQSRDDDYEPTKEEQRVLDQAKNIGIVKCHICGRSFNEQSGARHITFCEAQQKKNMMKRK